MKPSEGVPALSEQLWDLMNYILVLERMERDWVWLHTGKGVLAHTCSPPHDAGLQGWRCPCGQAWGRELNGQGWLPVE